MTSKKCKIIVSKLKINPKSNKLLELISIFLYAFKINNFKFLFLFLATTILNGQNNV